MFLVPKSRALFHQIRSHIILAVPDGIIQRSAAPSILCVDFSLVLHEKLHRLHVPLTRRKMERGSMVVVRHVRTSFGRKQLAELINVVLAGRCQQRSNFKHLAVYGGQATAVRASLASLHLVNHPDKVLECQCPSVVPVKFLDHLLPLLPRRNLLPQVAKNLSNFTNIDIPRVVEVKLVELLLEGPQFGLLHAGVQALQLSDR
mmetsp:Transcript_9410/g.21487  ORF Transcript_9410/g.21487 Transcript_9410/m.21487 type:complete len:203 (-) Transcript_9410:296-904(-)